MTGNIRILGRRLISRGNGLLEKFSVTRKRFDGRLQSLDREIYDTGDGAAILLYDPSRSRVVLVRQFRLTAFLRDGRESLFEVCAGRLDGEDADKRIIKGGRGRNRVYCTKPALPFNSPSLRRNIRRETEPARVAGLKTKTRILKS